MKTAEVIDLIPDLQEAVRKLKRTPAEKQRLSRALYDLALILSRDRVRQIADDELERIFTRRNGGDEETVVE